MSLSIDEVRHIARLARIELGEGEAQDTLDKLNNIFGLIEQMQAVDTSQVEPMSHPQDVIAAIRSALDEQHRGSAADTLLLHTAEQWRDRLLAGDDAVTAWMAEFPGTEPQPFRALVRQARKDAPAPGAAAESRGEAPRKGRAYRELFQWLRAELARAQEAAEDAAAAAPQAPSPGEDF